MRYYEIRCPVHGFIQLDEWEWAIINEPAFQRLRRIRQLGFTDYIYPGAMHTRFEHSLGVMHIATRLYDALCKNSNEVLKSELGYNEDGLRRDRRLVRLAALLHDVGHAPFSHASEESFPLKPNGERYAHEDYSSQVILTTLAEVVRSHPMNQNYRISPEEIASLLGYDAFETQFGERETQRLRFLSEIISSQMDADRMDYLLRDSYHLGVRYGVYDLERLINTIQAVPYAEDGTIRLGIGEDGWHAVESLILARYYMFTQVYFHKTRVAYDHHISEAMKSLLSGTYPEPTRIQEFLEWDDWRALGLIASGKAGEHGERIRQRNHYRLVFSAEATEEDSRLYQEVRQRLGDLVAHEEPASKSWYASEGTEIPIKMSDGRVRSLSRLSPAIGAMIKRQEQRYLYVRPEHAEVARKIVKEVIDGRQ